MQLVDSNVWLALAIEQHEFHASAKAWFKPQASNGGVLFCRATQQSFLRLITTKALTAYYQLPPLSNDAAWRMYDGFLADKRVSWVAEPRGLDPQWRAFAAVPTASPKVWMDAYLAAFAVAGGHRLVTIDAAFRQFPGLDLLVLTKR